MYYYFADKLDLYLAVIDAELTHIEAVALAAGPLASTDRESFWEELTVRASSLEATERDEEHAFAAALYQSGEGIARIFEWLTDRVTMLINSGIKRGAVRTDIPVDLLAAMIVGLLLGIDRYSLNSVPRVRPIAPQVLDGCRRIADVPST